MNQHDHLGLDDLVVQLTRMPSYTLDGDIVMPPCGRAPSFVRVDGHWQFGPHGIACPECSDVLTGRQERDVDYAELAQRIEVERDVVHHQFAALRMSLRSFGAERIVGLLDGVEDRFRRLDY